MNVQEGEARGRRTWFVLAAGEGESWTQCSFGGGQRSWKEQEALHELSCPAEVVGGARCTSSLGVRALVGDLGAGGVVATDAAEGLRSAEEPDLGAEEWPRDLGLLADWDLGPCTLPSG